MPATISYFDYDGSAPVRPEVETAVSRFLAEGPQNPTGVHAPARQARACLERARRSLADALSCDAAGLVFTGSGVEAVATALFGLAAPGRRAEGARVVTTAAERPETLEMLEDLEISGAEVLRVPVASSGQVRLEEWEAALDQGTDCALLHHACHETGVLQPLAEAGRICRAAGVPFVVDASWSWGRCRDGLLHEAAPDAFAISAHRAGGPAGVGALWARPGLNMRPRIPGSGERGRRGGVEPVAHIVGWAELVRIRREAGEAEDRRVRALRDGFEARIQESVPDCAVNGDEPRLPGTSCLSFEGIEGDSLALRLDLEGFAVSTGTACSSGSSRPGHVLPAMGLGPERALCAVRFSMGWATRSCEVDSLCGALPGIVEELREQRPGSRESSRASRDAESSGPV